MLPPSNLDERIEYYAQRLAEAAILGDNYLYEARRYLARTDLFFLLVNVMKRKDIVHPWLLARCDEIQADPDSRVDLWPREHYKSTAITVGKSIQDILNNPEVTIGIFSVTRPLAKGHLRMIKGEFERNVDMQGLFPDILWDNPQKDAPKWSEDDGIVVRRTTNTKESTVEAWGLIEGLPTGKHFLVRVYDDVIDKRAVSNPDMIAKATDSWEQSINLGAIGGVERYVGTRYHANDSWAEIIRRGVAKPRIYQATSNGKVDGEPVFMSKVELVKRRIANGPYNFSCQYMQDPSADNKDGFKETDLRYYDKCSGAGMNKYILVDPASSKKKSSDYTAMAVIALGQDHNYYLVDLVRDRLNLRERWEALLALHRRWRPKAVGYEKYGAQCDIEYLKEKMGDENYRFDVTQLGGSMSKPDRIKRLIPVVEENRFYLPELLIKENYEGKSVDLIHALIHEEITAFPVSHHDDMLDAISRIEDEDMRIVWPKEAKAAAEADRYSSKRRRRGAFSWLAA